jgi:hypothetical protein
MNETKIFPSPILPDRATSLGTCTISGYTSTGRHDFKFHFRAAPDLLVALLADRATSIYP